MTENVAVEKQEQWFSWFNLNRVVMEFLMRNFFNELQCLGGNNVPKTGPVIFCGNHCNQFVDGCILLTLGY